MGLFFVFCFLSQKAYGSASTLNKEQRMITQLSTPSTDDNCFFCGKQNQSGLKLSFFHDDKTGETFTEYTPEQHYQGQGDVFHGGLQMGLLDETMWWAGYAVTNIMEAVTANASFRFLRPVIIGRPLKAVCSVTAQTETSIKIKGRILNAEGKICTAVKGEFRIIDPEQYKKLMAAHS